MRGFGEESTYEFTLQHEMASSVLRASDKVMEKEQDVPENVAGNNQVLSKPVAEKEQDVEEVADGKQDVEEVAYKQQDKSVSKEQHPDKVLEKGQDQYTCETRRNKRQKSKKRDDEEGQYNNL